MRRRRDGVGRAGNRGAVANAARAVAERGEADRLVDRLLARLPGRTSEVLRRLDAVGDVDLPVRTVDEVAAAPVHEHLVGFYDDGGDLVEDVTSFLLPALRDGSPALVVATPEHTAAILAGLAAAGADVAGARDAGHLRCLDAAEVMAALLDGGRIDPDRFAATIAAEVAEAVAGGRTARVYGEVVALLWERGDFEAAVALEGLWNDLARSGAPFSLLCEYPTDVLDVAPADAAAAQLREVCHRHSALVGTAGGPGGTRPS